MGLLTDDDRRLLDALRAGSTLKQYAHDLHYSEQWAWWRSKQIRDKLGVAKIREAVRMTDVSRDEFEALQQRLDEALELVGKATATPAKSDPAATVSRSDLEDELRALGLSRKDLKDLSEQKFNERVSATVEQVLAKRDADAAAAAAAGKDDDDSDDDEGADDAGAANGKGFWGALKA